MTQSQIETITPITPFQKATACRRSSRRRSPDGLRVIGNQRGQGLIEYLIIVALMGVATIAIVRIMGEAVSKRFASITYALQGERKSIRAHVDENSFKKRDLGDFMNGSSHKGGPDDVSGAGAE